MEHGEFIEIATQFFDDFVAAFDSFDGAVIAQRYLAPYLAVQADGSIQCFAEWAQIADYFHKVVLDYHAQGCRTCRYRDLQVTSMGKRALLATVTWELLREDQSLLSSWRESYSLSQQDGQWRVIASVDHVL